ncbi:MAG: IgGFc-binding protein [Nannocystis sp.]|nr:IgGFc-binding protein [Nannocystis sp.]MBA3548930.1 IgGFc-binding protein [Nannocystis sp.]
MLRLTLVLLGMGPLLMACNDNGGADSTFGSATEVSGVTASSSTGGSGTNIVPTTGGGLTTEGTATATESGASTDSSSSSGGTTMALTGTSEGISSSTGPGTTLVGTDTLEFCPAGVIECEGGAAKVCDGMGGYSDETACEGVCKPGVGCLLCEPGETVCEGDASMLCSADGMSLALAEACDAVQGVTCNLAVGACDGACALQNLQFSYIGCDYYPTITLQHDSYNGGTKIFAAVIANSAGQDAQITITRGALMVEQFVVPAGGVKEVPLKWVTDLTKGVGPSKVTVDGAYRIRSDRPVTVYQYNLLYSDASNDASLLLPVNAWTGEYVVASFPHAAVNNYPGFYTVVAREDNTLVTLSPSATGGKVQAGAGVAADGTGQVMLNADDVLQVATAAGGDLTGTRISADRAVQVIAGHKCSKVPQDVDSCDHLEEAMFPVEALAKEYIVVPPVQSPNDKLLQGQMVRVIASEANTTVTFTPDQGANAVLKNAGDFIELSKTVAAFKVAADKKILVAQYMVGQGGGFGAQDPSMLLAVATEQYRKDYLFQAPNTWTANYVDIILKSGTAVSVDGVPVMGFVKIAGTDYSVAHVLLSKDGTGQHTLTAAAPVGISVYGIQDFGSYWVAGGLDLDHL